MERQLRRNRQNRMLFGVAGGIARYFNIDPVVVRVAFVALAFLNGIGVLLYILFALIMPKDEALTADPARTVGENVRSLPGDLGEAGRRLTGIVRSGGGPGPGTP